MNNKFLVTLIILNILATLLISYFQLRMMNMINTDTELLFHGIKHVLNEIR